MDIVINLCSGCISLALWRWAALPSFGMPVVGAQMPTRRAETRPTLFQIAKRLSTLGRAALASLIVTGPLMFWLKSGAGGVPACWFWAKMVLVLLLLGRGHLRRDQRQAGAERRHGSRANASR